MRRPPLFTKDRSVYWPGEFSDVVDFLTGRDRDGRQIGNGLYSLNIGPIVLAAALGLREGRKRDVGTDRKEIATSTFASNGYESFIFLVALLGSGNASPDLLRPENEEQVVREFERFAAGGLELLAGEIESSRTKSPDMIVQALMYPSETKSEERASDLPDLMT